MKRWFYKHFYLLIAAARERLDLVTVKLGKVEDNLWELSIKAERSQNEKEVMLNDCKSN